MESSPEDCTNAYLQQRKLQIARNLAFLQSTGARDTAYELHVAALTREKARPAKKPREKKEQPAPVDRQHVKRGCTLVPVRYREQSLSPRRPRRNQANVHANKLVAVMTDGNRREQWVQHMK